jgi:hypothetical protein
MDGYDESPNQVMRGYYDGDRSEMLPPISGFLPTLNSHYASNNSMMQPKITYKSG